MAVIHIGEGKHIEHQEGALRRVPYVPAKQSPRINRPPVIQKDRSKPRSQKFSGENHWYIQYAKKVPGYLPWVAMRMRECAQKKVGRKLGQAAGLRAKEADVLWAIAKEKAKKDMANIKKVMDLDANAEEAMTNTLEVMRSPMNQQIKLAAAKQILEWSMAKPVSKSAVTVTSAEDWLAKLNDPSE